jgi:tetratricopeptide (TPR) repeat protein
MGAMSALEQLLEAGETEKAKAAAEKALAKQPQDRSALVVLSKVLLLEGQLDKAEQHLARAEQTGASAETLLLRANLAAQRGQLQPAVGYFRQAISREPQRAEAHFGLGLVLFKDGKAEEGLLSLEKAVKLEPENAVFVYRLGQVRLEAGHTDRGIQAMAQAIVLQPRFLAPYLTLTQALLEQNRLVEAKKVLKEGLRAIPNHPRLLAMTTALALGIGDEQLSYVAAKTLADQRPKDPKAQANLALLLLVRGQHEDAMRLCRTMESQGLATAELKMIEATVHEAAEPPAYDRAAAAYEQAMVLDPSGWKAPNNLGILLLRMPGDPPDQHLPRALAVLQEAVQRNPNQPEPRLNLALAYTRMGDKANAQIEAMTALAADLPEGHPVREQAQQLIASLG